MFLIPTEVWEPLLRVLSCFSSFRLILDMINWEANLLCTALGVILYFLHSTAVIKISRGLKNFMPRNTSCTLSFEVKLWNPGVPLIRLQMCGFAGNILACAKAILSFPCQMYLQLWQVPSLFFCQGPVVAVGGRTCVDQLGMESSQTKGSQGCLLISVVRKDGVSAGFETFRSTSYFYCGRERYSWFSQ